MENQQIPDVPTRVIERQGHIDVYYRWTRVSLLPEPPKTPTEIAAEGEGEDPCGPGCTHEHHDHKEEAHECDDSCDHEAEQAAARAAADEKFRLEFEAAEAAPKVYKKVFIREGLRTETHPAPMTLTRDAFVKIFSCPHDELLDFLVNGDEEEQWLASLREENIPKMNPVVRPAEE